MIYVWDLLGVEDDVKTKHWEKAEKQRGANRFRFHVMCMQIMKNPNRKKFSFNVTEKSAL